MQLAWFQLLVSPIKLLPPADLQLFEAHFRISMLTPPSAALEVRGQLDLFLKERCVELCCAASITNNRTTELRAREVLCCLYEISHLWPYLESRKTLRYGGVQRLLKIIIIEKNRQDIHETSSELLIPPNLGGRHSLSDWCSKGMPPGPRQSVAKRCCLPMFLCRLAPARQYVIRGS